jgi:hypothetical protein
MIKLLIYSYKINNSKKMEIWVKPRLLLMRKKHFQILPQKKIQGNCNKKFLTHKKCKQQTKINQSQQPNLKK